MFRTTFVEKNEAYFMPIHFFRKSCGFRDKQELFRIAYISEPMYIFCTKRVSQPIPKEPVGQWCPTFLYIGAHLTDDCGGAGAVWRVQ
jgi:hypothetical protein